MPIWIPILIIFGVVALGTVVALNWDDLVINLKGKKLAVLGEREVGKTHLCQFLSTGTIPDKYEQTLDPEPVGNRRFKLQDLDLKIKKTKDVAGDKVAYGEWKKLFDEADVVLYLFRADKIILGDKRTEERIRDDMRHIGQWLDTRSKRPHFFLIGTHCDLDPKFKHLTADNLGTYRDDILQKMIIIEAVLMAGGSKNVKVLIDSMKSIEWTERLVFNIFKQIVD